MPHPNLESNKWIDPSFEIKLSKLNDKLIGLRREKKEIIKILHKIKDLECTRQGTLVTEYAKLNKTEIKLKDKILQVNIL